MSLSISDFVLRGMSFEVRYPTAYLFWDRAGQIAEDLRSRYPAMRLASAEPGKTVFAIAKQEVSWQLDRLVILDFGPGSSQAIDDFFKICEDCFAITIDNLGITELSRVGIRPTFIRSFSSKEEAAAKLAEAAILHIPDGKQFNVDPIATYPEYSIRREGEKFGYYLRAYAETFRQNFESPPQWRGTVPETKEEHALMLDVDYYTRASMQVGALKVKELLSQVLHVVRRDADNYFQR